MNVTPTKSRVLVAENATQNTTDSGLILDHTNSARDSRTGTVLAIGNDVKDLRVGDKILLDWSKGAVVKIGDAQRVIIDEKDVVAVLEGE